MIKVGIIGGAGYTAGELIRILLGHPDAEIVFVNSTSNAGNKLSAVHEGLIGETDMVFTDQLPLDTIDVLFFCTAHGDTRKFMEANTLPEGLKVIDLSMDYRLEADDNPFIYGLPELNRRAICKSQYVANPGCFATAIQLALLPLARNLMLNDDIYVNAITGSTGICCSIPSSLRSASSSSSPITGTISALIFIPLASISPNSSKLFFFITRYNNALSSKMFHSHIL